MTVFVCDNPLCEDYGKEKAIQSRKMSFSKKDRRWISEVEFCEKCGESLYPKSSSEKLGNINLASFSNKTNKEKKDILTKRAMSFYEKDGRDQKRYFERKFWRNGQKEN